MTTRHSLDSLRSTSRALPLSVLVLLVALSSRAIHAASRRPPSPVDRVLLLTPNGQAKSANQISLADYQVKLHALEELVVACQQAMSPAACPSDQVGPDLELDLDPDPGLSHAPHPTRSVRFGWLRNLLDHVAHPIATPETPPTNNPPPSLTPSPALPRQASPKPGRIPSSQIPQQSVSPPPSIPPERNPPMPPPEDVIGIASTPNIFKQLESARRRLVQDQLWAAAAKTPTTRAASAESQHRALAAILAQKEYHSATTGRTIKDRILEKIANWIDSVVGALIRAGSKSKWIGVTAEVAFVSLLSIGLVWLLIRLERQGRLGSSLLLPSRGTGAASERDWRLWADDARSAAQKGAWREAIHFLYWSNISRLESSGLWPADRARTPREYLALIPASSRQHSHLNELTLSFERTWYAGQPAAQSDFDRVERISASLGSSAASAPSSAP